MNTTKTTKKSKRIKLADRVRNFLATKSDKELANLDMTTLVTEMNKGKKTAQKVGYGQFRQIFVKEASTRGFEILKLKEKGVHKTTE